jgi:hypothetical protein
MMSQNRADLLRVLAELSELHPEMRLGQLVANLTSLVDLGPGAVWDVEDEALLEAAREHLESQLRKIAPASAEQ